MTAISTALYDIDHTDYVNVVYVIYDNMRW